MGLFEIIGGILLILVSLFLILFVMLQEGNAGNPAAVMGGTDSYYDQNNTKTKERILQSATKFATIIFFVLAFALNIVLMLLK